MWDEHPFTSYFDVHQGYKVLTHCHIDIDYINMVKRCQTWFQCSKVIRCPGLEAPNLAARRPAGWHVNWWSLTPSFTWLTWGVTLLGHENRWNSQMIPNSLAGFYSFQGLHNCTVMPWFVPSRWGTDPWHVKWRWMKADLRNEDVDLSVLPGQVPFPGPETCKLRRQKRSRSKHTVASVVCQFCHQIASPCRNAGRSPVRPGRASYQSVPLRCVPAEKTPTLYRVGMAFSLLQSYARALWPMVPWKLTLELQQLAFNISPKLCPFSVHHTPRSWDVHHGIISIDVSCLSESIRLSQPRARFCRGAQGATPEALKARAAALAVRTVRAVAVAAAVAAPQIQSPQPRGTGTAAARLRGRLPQHLQPQMERSSRANAETRTISWKLEKFVSGHEFRRCQRHEGTTKTGTETFWQISSRSPKTSMQIIAAWFPR